MNRPNTILKVVSILYIVFNIIGGIMVVAGSLGLGVLIGGAACDLLFGEAGQDFRATKDLDLVL